MVQVFVLVVLWLHVISAEDFDPSKFDYCTIPNCNHTACKCDKVVGKRVMLLDDMVNFRTAMVNEHNSYRNKIANGEEEKSYNFPKAANMHVFNYDHDQCKTKHDSDLNPGQNIFGVSKRIEEKKNVFYRMGVEDWYEEIKLIKDASIVDAYSNADDAKIGHFTQLIWGSARLVGCSKVYIDEENHLFPAYRSVIVCNYQGIKSEGGSGNVLKRPIYIKGDPCTKCPNNEKCNNQYAGGKWNSLCGESLPIPTQKPFVKADRKDDDDANGTDTKRQNGKGKAHHTSGNQCFILWMATTVFFYAHVS